MTHVRRPLRSIATATALLALLCAVLMTAPAGAVAPWTAPHVERVFGGPSRPGIAAWGIAYNPVTDELIVGDYVSQQVRRYSRDGTWVADFANPLGYVPGVVSAIAVDPSDGSTYVAVTGDGSNSRDVRKYDVDGNYVYGADLVGNITWLTVDDDGHVWAPGAFSGPGIREYSFDDATKTATELRSIGTKGSGPGELNRLTGIDVDADGNVYVADPGNGTVHVFGPGGGWRFDVGNKSLFPGDLRGVAVNDASDRLYVANSQIGTIEIFDLSGIHLGTFGDLGAGDGEFPDGARQMAITPDDHLWAADYASQRVQEFSMGGTYLGQFPHPPQQPDPAGLASARGVAVDPVTGDVLVADNWNQRVQRFAPDGTLLRTFGQRGSFPPSGMNYPRSVAVDPATRNVWVGNYEGDPDVMVFTPDFQLVRHIVTPRFVNDIDIVDGEAFVLFRRITSSQGGVKVYDTTTGALLRSYDTRIGWVRCIAVDPATGNMWITADSGKNVYVLGPNGALQQTLSVDSRPWGITIDGDVVYVADTAAHRVIAFDRTSYQRLGAFGAQGAKPGQFVSPSGIEHDGAGDLYVVEDKGARVQRFGWSQLPQQETTKPTITWTTPPPSVPLTIQGSAADASRVLQVEVTVQDAATGLYWNARSASWGIKLTWNHAIVWGPLATPSWRFTLVPTVAGTTYTVKARALDTFGNVSRILTGSFARN
jgi:DNA-binding beta-propeller fold protein YncE